MLFTGKTDPDACEVKRLGGALMLICFHFGVYGIWGDLAAWEIFLQGVAVTCLQFLELSKRTQKREVKDTKSVKDTKCRSEKSRDVIFLEKKAPAGRSTTSPRAWFHYLPLSAANHSAICSYLLLFVIICRYLPLASPLFAAICR